MAKKATPRKKFEGVKVTTPTFRASFMNVFTPQAYEDGPEKYSVEMLFDKKKTDLKPMRAKLKEICVTAWGKDEKKWPKNFRWPFKDGDDRDSFTEDAPEERLETYSGHLFCRADSLNQPGIYDQNKEDIMDKNEIFSGCYCKASLFAVPYANVGGRGADGRSGVKLYLQGVQLVAVGEKLGGSDSRDDFEVIENEDDDSGDSDDEEEDPGF